MQTVQKWNYKLLLLVYEKLLCDGVKWICECDVVSAACWSTEPDPACILWGPLCSVGTQRDSTIPLRHSLLHVGFLFELAHTTGNSQSFELAHTTGNSQSFELAHTTGNSQSFELAHTTGNSQSSLLLMDDALASLGPIMLISLFLVLLFNFLFIPCGRLSWLPVGFLLHVKYTLSCRNFLI